MRRVKQIVVSAAAAALLVLSTALPAAAHAHEGTCREVFSDGVCSTVEYPWPVVWWATDQAVDAVLGLCVFHNNCT